jgi:hypothetical protein
MVRYDKFYGGIAQDDRIQSVWEYIYGQNINIRRGKWIELMRKPELVSDAWSGGYVSAVFIDTLDNDKLWVGDSTWDISYSDDNGVTYNTVFIGWVSDNVLAIQVFSDDFIYWIDNKMYVRTNFRDWNPWVLWGNVTEVSTNASDYRQTILVGDDAILFTNGKQIGKIVSSSPTTINNIGDIFSQTFSASTDLVGLTLHGNSIWAYEKTGKMYALDNQSEDVIWFKDFKEEILAVRNVGGYDLVVTTSWAWLYARSWFANTGVSPESTQLIRRYVLSPTIEQQLTLWGYKFTFERFNNGLDYCFAELDGITYWIGDDGGDWHIIYSYWSNNNILPESTSIICDEYRGYDWLTWGSIQCLWSYDGYLYIAGNRWTAGYVAKIKLFDAPSGNLYKEDGYIITKVDDFWQYEIPKTIKQVMVGADIPTWTSLQLDYSINEWPFVAYKTITNTDALWTNGKKFEFSTPIEMFNEISWRIKLITTDETLTPKLYSFSHELETELYQKSQ